MNKSVLIYVSVLRVRTVSCASRRLLLFLRILANFMVLLVMAGSSFGIQKLVDRASRHAQAGSRQHEISWWDANEVSENGPLFHINHAYMPLLSVIHHFVSDDDAVSKYI